MHKLSVIVIATVLRCLTAIGSPSNFSNTTVTTKASTWDEIVKQGIQHMQSQAPHEDPELIQVFSGYVQPQNAEGEVVRPTIANLYFDVISAHGSIALSKFRTGWWEPTEYYTRQKTNLQAVQPIEWPPALTVEDAHEVLIGSGFKTTFNRFHLDWRTKAFGALSRVDQPYWTFEWMEKPYQVVQIGMDRKVWKHFANSLEDFDDIDNAAAQGVVVMFQK
ncbi:uncharacterized protein KY384_005125 [Bacidia gigantensis]|uniref:uncharacterized protein n=1 Tax=Bacidia gigantensis TaxID=2732470 RepID=UPI001D04A5E0|nr:uncharacterized protein KY384_005125 [Bacidia gigantensis]KAG8529644.1 hypothetical protein KY384_005125 [Bacidia gigantensis]